MNFCVFCGSRFGGRDDYRQAALRIGEALVERGIGLVYGGGQVGLMGVVADSVLKKGGNAFGVIPRSMARREVAHQGLTELHIVEGMHPRKAMMASLSRAFVALPGGFGTFEELFEVTTWLQLGYHDKPIGLLNVAGYFSPFLDLVENGIREGFVSASNRDLITVEDDPDRLIDALEARLVPHGGDAFEIEKT